MACGGLSADDDPELHAVLLADPRLAPILSEPHRFRAQVLVTEVRAVTPGPGPGTGSGDEDGAEPARSWVLQRRGFRSGAEYFYPASAVKLMGAAAACLKIQQMAHKHRPDRVDDDDDEEDYGSGGGGGERRLRFHLDLDTPLVFEPCGLVPSIADSRAKTDRALRARDRIIKLAEERLDAMERAEQGNRDHDEVGNDMSADSDDANDPEEEAACAKRRKAATGDPDDFDVAAAARAAAAVVVDDQSAARIAADMDAFIAAYAVSSVPDDGGSGDGGLSLASICRISATQPIGGQRSVMQPICSGGSGGDDEAGGTPPPGCSPPTSFAAVVRALFLVSDNEAFNRCYDIAGPARINAWANNVTQASGKIGSGDGDDEVGDEAGDESGDEAGDEVRDGAGCAVQHRLYSAATDSDNSAYLPAVWAKVKLVQATGVMSPEARWVRILPARSDQSVIDPRHPKVSAEEEDNDQAAIAAGNAVVTTIGTAHITAKGIKVDAPLDCSARNRATLAALQDALVKIARPELAVGAASTTAAGAQATAAATAKGPEDKDAADVATAGPSDPHRRYPLADASTAAFSEILSEPHRRFLLDVMSQYPRQSLDPVYSPEEHPDHSGKFFLPGLTRLAPQSSLVVANKAGRAYGFSVGSHYADQEFSVRCLSHLSNLGAVRFVYQYVRIQRRDLCLINRL